MKYCGNCGAQLEDDELYCDECGAKQTMQDDIPASGQAGKEASAKLDKNRVAGGKKVPIVAVVGILCVAVVIVIAIYVMSQGDTAKKGEAGTANQEENATLLNSLAWDEPDANVKMLGKLKLTDYGGKAVEKALEEAYEIGEIKGAKEADKMYICYQCSDGSDVYEVIISEDEDANVIVEELYKNSKKLNDEQTDEFCKEVFAGKDDENVEDEEDDQKDAKNDDVETENGDKNTDNQDDSAESVPTPEPQQPTPELSDQNVNYGDAYGSILMGLRGGYDGEYALYDMNHDGIRELIVSYGTCNADWSNAVYTINPQDMSTAMYVGSFDLISTYCESADGNGIYAIYQNYDSVAVWQVTLSDNSLQVTELYNCPDTPVLNMTGIGDVSGLYIVN